MYLCTGTYTYSCTIHPYHPISSFSMHPVITQHKVLGTLILLECTESLALLKNKSYFLLVFFFIIIF